MTVATSVWRIRSGVGMEGESLEPQLDKAQKALETALTEACGVDVHDVDTGELIRIEETLATAASAAKDAVSVRLKLRARRQADRRVADLADAPPRVIQRIFEDIRGKRWVVHAVQPTSPASERVALPEAFRSGWLTFESPDETRRVAPIPADWEDLPTDVLRDLCYKAPATPKRAATEPASTQIIKREKP